MGWLKGLYGKVVFLDTAPIVYYIEKEYPNYKELLDPFFDMVADNKCSAITSVMSLLEVLVVPIRRNNVGLIREFRNFFYHTRIQTIEITPEIAEKAARLRAFHAIKTPDAIQIATAISAGATAFLTNDAQLASIPDIQVLVLKDLKMDS